MSTYNIIIVLPGTTGSTLIDGTAGYDPATPIWPDGVIAKTLLIGPGTGAQVLEGFLNPNTSSKQTPLFPGIVAGWGKPTSGYGSLASSLANGLAAEGQPCTVVSAQWPLTLTNPTQQVAQAGFASSANSWGLPPGPLTSHMLVGFAYDWRLDNATTARIFQNFLYNLNVAYGSAIGKIFLVAHSMGGIVSRTYLETVAVANSANDPLFGNIKALFTLGTPHLGAPLAIDAVNGTLNMSTYVAPIVIDNVSIGFGPFDTMVADFVDNTKYNSPSTYELIPPPATNIPTAQQSLVNCVTVGSTAWNAFNTSAPFTSQVNVNSTDFTAASSLLTSLSAKPFTTGGPVPYYCIYGISSQYPTCTGQTYSASGPTWTDAATPSGGDQIVPQQSAMFAGAKNVVTLQAKKVSPVVQPVPPANSVNHLQLPGSPDAQAAILNWIFELTA